MAVNSYAMRSFFLEEIKACPLSFACLEQSRVDDVFDAEEDTSRPPGRFIYPKEQHSWFHGRFRTFVINYIALTCVNSFFVLFAQVVIIQETYWLLKTVCVLSRRSSDNMIHGWIQKLGDG